MDFVKLVHEVHLTEYSFNSWSSYRTLQPLVVLSIYRET